MQTGLVAGAIAAIFAAASSSAAPSSAVWFTSAASLDENEALMREAAPEGAMWEWIGLADIPANAVPASESRSSISLQVEISALGKMTGCTAKQAALLAEIACAKLRERGRFVVALDRTGRPAADTLVMDLVYEPKLVPVVVPAPPEPPAVDPALMTALSSLAMVGEPAWGNFVPQDRGRRGDVTVLVFLFRNGADPKIDCSIIAGAPDPALDTATCAALKAAEYGETAKSYSASTLLVRWNGNTARIEKPRRVRGASFAFDREAARQAVATLPEGATPGTARLTFTGSGKAVKCKITRSTGIDSADLAACRKLEAIRYTPAIDIFDRPLDAVKWMPIGATQ